MMRALLVGCCLVGIAIGAGLAPAIGIQTPVPDLGADGDDLDLSFGDTDEAGIEQYGGSGGSGVGDFGGISAGGYPEEATVGGELTLSEHEELVVESPAPSRWRLGAYAEYTGDGWERTGDREPLTEPLPTALDRQPRPEHEIQVTPQRPFRTLVTAPRPAFGTAGDREILVDEEGGLTVDEPVASGEQYTTLTYGPASRSAAAVASDGNVPPAIENRYAQLPDSTPDRLGEQTDEITADADTPYQAAVAVESWLQENKEYSLETTHDRDGDVADEFVFEMDAGYCQYFATSMVAMLRTQGIPARYVTGYGPGEQVDDDEYLVRGENAHAWVEVYIADVGWVTFDPTPADGRLEAGRDEASLDDLGDGWSPDQSANDSNATESDAEPPDGSDADAVDVTLLSDPVPGREMTVAVTHDTNRVRNATVLFDGEAVGETNRAGAVSGTVPYVRSLEVTVRVDGGVLQLAGTTSAGGDSSQRPTLENVTNATTTVHLPTDISVDSVGEAVAGEDIELVATLAGEPVREANVRVDGETVGETDDEGVVTLALPDAETVDVTVERGEASGERSLILRDEQASTPGNGGSGPLDVFVDTGALILPYTTATVYVEHEGEPVQNATVIVAGETVGETTGDGTLAVRVPLADPMTVSATAPAETSGSGDPLGETASADMGDSTLTGSVAIGDTYRHLGSVTGVGLLVVAGFAGITRRRNLTGRRNLTAAAMNRSLRGQAVTGFVGLASALDGALPELAGGVKRAGSRFRERPTAGVALFLAGIRWTLCRAHPGAIAQFVRHLVRSVGIGAAEPTATGNADEEPPTIRQAWAHLGTHVTVESWRTSTPGEIARWAVDRDGLPPEPVATLRDAFREAEYGPRRMDDPAPEVREALEEIRASADESADEEREET